MRTALLNVTILTLDPARRVISDGCIIIWDDRIEALGRQAELGQLIAKAETTIDGRGMVAMPGLVNAHTHSFQSMLRGLADGMNLLEFLNNLVYPVTKVMTPEQFRLGATLTVLEAIKSGTTCIIDNHSGNTSLAVTDSIAEVFADSGARALVARGLRQETARARAWHVPSNVFQFSLEEELEITRDLITKWQREINGRVQVCPAPLTLFLASPDDLKAAKALANEYSTPIHVHIAETQSEVDATLEDYGQREIEHLAQLGVLDDKFHVVHGIWLDEHELDLMAESGGHIVHCPTSNMTLGSGIAHVPEMLARGVNVALASDGIGNLNHDMFSVMKTGLLLHRVRHLQADVLSADQILEMATLGGARALGLENEIGSLEVGKKADVILINLDRPHLVPTYNIASTIVHGANSADVNTVIVDGKVIMKDRQVTSLDEKVIISEAQAAGQELFQMAGLDSEHHRLLAAS